MSNRNLSADSKLENFSHYLIDVPDYSLHNPEKFEKTITWRKKKGGGK